MSVARSAASNWQSMWQQPGDGMKHRTKYGHANVKETGDFIKLLVIIQCYVPSHKGFWWALQAVRFNMQIFNRLRGYFSKLILYVYTMCKHSKELLIQLPKRGCFLLFSLQKEKRKSVNHNRLQRWSRLRKELGILGLKKWIYSFFLFLIFLLFFFLACRALRKKYKETTAEVLL